MRSVLKQVRQRHLSTEDLLLLGDAVSDELERRFERNDAVPDSARHRFVRRWQSYRHDTGSAALPVRIVGLRGARRPCMA